MYPLNHFFPFIFLLAFITLLKLAPTTLASQNNGFKATLINRDSRMSPFYKPNMTDTDRLNTWTKRSDDRLQYFKKLSSSENSIKSFVFPGQSTYLMKLVIGTPRSFINNLRYNKFSYCLPTSTDSGSFMYIGASALLAGNATPMVSDPSSFYHPEFYYINWDDITVGNVRLNLEPDFLTLSGGEGTITDSGTPLTRIRKEAYVNMTNELINQIKLKRVPDVDRYLCYHGTEEDLKKGNIPGLIFHFEDLDVPVPQESAFREVSPGTICLMMLPSDGMSIFGSFAQQNLNVGHDLENMEIYMTPMDCTKE